MPPAIPSNPPLSPAIGVPCFAMEYLIAFMAAVCLFVAFAPEAVTQTALAATWALFALFIVGELLYYSGRFLLSLL